MSNATLTRHGIHMLTGDEEVVGNLQIVLDDIIYDEHKRPTARFRIVIVDADGRALSTLINQVAISVGSTATILDLHKAFDVKFEVTKE